MFRGFTKNFLLKNEFTREVGGWVISLGFVCGKSSQNSSKEVGLLVFWSSMPYTMCILFVYIVKCC